MRFSTSLVCGKSVRNLTSQAVLVASRKPSISALHTRSTSRIYQTRGSYYNGVTRNIVSRRTVLQINMGDPKELHNATSGADDDWKHQAPYKEYKKGEGFDSKDVKHEASCHCGRVQYQLNRDAPLDSKLCHCRDCQIQHGAPFQWAAIFHKEVRTNFRPNGIVKGLVHMLTLQIVGYQLHFWP